MSSTIPERLVPRFQQALWHQKLNWEISDQTTIKFYACTK